MKRYLVFIGLIAITTIAVTAQSCGKGGEPAPAGGGTGIGTGNGNGTGTGGTGTGTGGTGTGGTGTGGTGTGGTGNGNGGTGGTSYTNNPTQDIIANAGTINYDMSQQIVTGTVATNANGGGVQTTSGGMVTVELLNATDDNMTLQNLGDALEADFKTNADPILEYTVTDDAAKTITKYDVHLNKGIGSTGHLYLQGNTSTAFNDKTVTYNAAYLTLKAKTANQSVQKLAVK